MTRSSGPEFLGINLRNALTRLAINAVAILLAAKLIDGIEIDNWKGVILAAAIFGVVNALIKPIVKRLTCPLYLLTMGLFALVVNAVMLALTSWISDQLSAGFRVNGFVADFTGAIVIGVVAWLLSMALP